MSQNHEKSKIAFIDMLAVKSELRAYKKNLTKIVDDITSSGAKATTDSSQEVARLLYVFAYAKSTFTLKDFLAFLGVESNSSIIQYAINYALRSKWLAYDNGKYIYNNNDDEIMIPPFPKKPRGNRGR